MEVLQETFKAQYGCNAEFYARAPGRVNLIGEHIDHSGYSVAPMAIEQNVIILVSKSKNDLISIKSTIPTFDSFIGHSHEFQNIDLKNIKWYNYVFCGFLAIQEAFQLEKSVGLNILVSGTVPQGAGLSSSAALVVCSALIFQHANKLSGRSNRRSLAETCAKAERNVGVLSGGMDQSISLLAEQGKAKIIHFNPLGCDNIPLPKGVAFIVAHSLAKKEKALSNDYNQRVAECRLASLILQKNKLGQINLKDIPTLKRVQDDYNCNLSDMINHVTNVFGCDAVDSLPQPLSRQKVLEILDVTDNDLKVHVLSENTADMQEFCVYKRAKHVYSEALRVEEFKRACDENRPGVMKKLGNLMNESHSSCASLFQCSSQELDILTSVMCNAGAFGSRLTGAGWGGCTVSLIHESDEKKVIDRVYNEFYVGKEYDNIDNVLFVAKPSQGAAIHDMDGKILW